MGGGQSTTTTTTTQATSIATTTPVIPTTTPVIQTTTVSPRLTLESQISIAFSCIALILVLALSSAAIYIFWWRKTPLPTVTCCQAGKEKAEADCENETPHTIIYGNVGTVAKDDVDVDVTYSDVTVMKRTGTIVLLPDTSEYATVMTSK